MTTFPGTIELSSLDGTNGFRLDGAAADDRSGFSVSNAGDINGDGFKELIVGAPGADGGAGSSYVVFGKASGFAGSIDLSTLDGSNGFRIDGVAADDTSGWSVSNAGDDVNGDGLGDLLIGAFHAGPNGNTQAGSSYVVFGKPSGFAATLDLSSLDGGNGFRLDGVAADDRSGFAVSSVGDVNGDGFTDMIVGAPYADPNGNADAGSSYLVFGRGSGFAATFDLASLDGSNGLRLDGAAAGDLSGQSVSSAGDIDGDGFRDLIIGAPGADPNGKGGAGSSYVVFGKASGFAATLALSSLDGTTGFRLDGANALDGSGFSVSGAGGGDVNGDGFADVVVGAPNADPDGRSGAGSSYVVFGKASGFAATLALSRLNGRNGFRIDGAADEQSGLSVSGPGDVDGDGFGDLIVGASGAGPNGDAGAGASYVVFGKASGFTATLDLAALDGSNGFRLDGVAADDRSGSSVSRAGDINGDGFADLIVGAYGADPGGDAWSGSSYVVFGRAPTEAVTRIGTSAANTIRGGSGNDQLSGLGGDDRLFGAAGDDALDGGTGRDRLTGGAGADTITGGNGDDRIVLAGGDFASGERIDGGGNADTIQLVDATTVDFSDGMLAGVERLLGSASADVVTLSAPQWAAFARIALGGGADTIQVLALGDITASGRPGVAGAETSGLVGTGGGDSVTLTGRQLDAILIGAGTIGAGTIDLGGGIDSLLLASSSRDLNLLGTTDAAISGVESIGLVAAAGSLDLSGQSEGFSLIGSGFDDRLTGGSGNDVIAGSTGRDLLTGGAGADTFFFQAAADGVDTILDFTRGEDVIELASGFGGGLVAGPVPDGAFFAGPDPLSTTSASGDGRLLYDSAGAERGTLYWDVDGASAANAVAFARLSGAPVLSASDVTVV